MKPIPIIDELRETRRRLAEEQLLDVERYAAMLRQVANSLPGKYVDTPLVPPSTSPASGHVKNAG